MYGEAPMWMFMDAKPNDVTEPMFVKWGVTKLVDINQYLWFGLYDFHDYEDVHGPRSLHSLVSYLFDNFKSAPEAQVRSKWGWGTNERGRC